MKPATAASFWRGVAPVRSVSSIALSSSDQRCDEELVEDLVLGGEVVVDEPVGDVGLVGDVGDPGRVEALAGEDPDGGVEDLAGASRPRRFAAIRRDASGQLRPDVGGRAAVGERGQDSRTSLLRGEVEVGGDEAFAVGDAGEDLAPGVDDRRVAAGVEVRRRRADLVRRRGRRPGSRSPGPGAAPPSGRGRWWW